MDHLRAIYDRHVVTYRQRNFLVPEQDRAVAFMNEYARLTQAHIDDDADMEGHGDDGVDKISETMSCLRVSRVWEESIVHASAQG